MPVDYTIAKPTPGTSRATSPTETEILTDVSDTIADIDSRLNAKAPLASPALTGTPTVPTAPAGTNTTQAASTAFVKSEVDNATSGAAVTANVNAVMQAPSSGDWNTTQLDASFAGGGMRYGPSTVNNTATWSITLAAGTYTFTLLHRREPNRGIYTVTVDGATLGAGADGYAAAADDKLDTWTGVIIAADGPTTVTFTMATKNASSSGYYGAVEMFAFTRTGA